jgi:hypothetical protein
VLKGLGELKGVSNSPAASRADFETTVESPGADHAESDVEYRAVRSRCNRAMIEEVHCVLRMCRATIESVTKNAHQSSDLRSRRVRFFNERHIPKLSRKNAFNLAVR